VGSDNENENDDDDENENSLNSKPSSFISKLSPLLGKLLPYTLIFVAEAMLANVVFFHWEYIPMEGNMGLFALTTVLFIVATQSVAVILYALFPVLSLVISVVSMVGSLGATLSGLTFPLSAMSSVVQWMAKLFPVRHFTEAMQCMVYFDGGFSACWPQLAVLCLFPLVAVALLYFKNAADNDNDNENENHHPDGL
jgi:ABC-2 type transport system permease protein